MPGQEMITQQWQGIDSLRGRIDDLERLLQEVDPVPDVVASGTYAGPWKATVDSGLDVIVGTAANDELDALMVYPDPLSAANWLRMSDTRTITLPASDTGMIYLQLLWDGWVWNIDFLTDLSAGEVDVAGSTLTEIRFVNRHHVPIAYFETDGSDVTTLTQIQYGGFTVTLESTYMWYYQGTLTVRSFDITQRLGAVNTTLAVPIGQSFVAIWLRDTAGALNIELASTPAAGATRYYRLGTIATNGSGRLTNFAAYIPPLFIGV